MRTGPDGTHAVYYSTGNEWVVHNALDGRQTALPIDDDGIYGFYLSADNRFLAVSMRKAHPSALERARAYLERRSGTDVACVFDTTTGAQVALPMRGGGTCCFAPDGNTLAVVDRISQITLWDWPPPNRWPLTLLAAAATMLLSCGISAWWSRKGSKT